MSNTMNRFVGVTRNIAIMSVGIFVNKATGTVLFIVFARYLGEVGFGRYAFATLFAVLSDLGLSTLAVRAVAQDRALTAKYLDNIGILSDDEKRQRLARAGQRHIQKNTWDRATNLLEKTFDIILQDLPSTMVP